MYRVLLVDDDCLVRQTLKDMIDWEKFGFSIIGEAIDGIDAMNKISSQKPDILILDMSMPQADGIEVIQYVLKKGYPIKILVLSCYDDFNYVKEALKLGATDYMLKHLLKKEPLIENLHTIKQEIEQSKHQSQITNNMKQIAREGTPLLKNKLLIKLLHERHITQKSEKEFKRYCKKLEPNNLGLIYVKVQEYEKAVTQFEPNGIEIFSLVLTNIVDEVIQSSNNCEIANDGEGRFVILINLDNFSQLQNKESLEAVITKVRHALQTYLKINTHYITSMKCASFIDLWQLYGQLDNKFSHFFYEKADKTVLFSDQLPPISLEEIKIDDQRVALYKDYIKKDQFTLLQNAMFQECHQLMEKKIVPVNVKKYYVSLLRKLYDYIYEHFNINRDYAYIKATTEQIFNSKNIKELLIVISGIAEYAENLISNELVSEVENDYIKEAIKYIQSHYMEDIILADVAAHIHVTRTYFSHLFKQNTGKKFIDYIKEIRMKKACDYLLNSDLKIKEIGERVGIPNRKYFSKSFKEVMGLSPQEYKRQNI